MSDSPVVVMDEPTSALDAASREHVVRFIMTSFKERTLIMVTHDQTLMGNVDTIFEMRDKKLVERKQTRHF